MRLLLHLRRLAFGNTVGPSAPLQCSVKAAAGRMLRNQAQERWRPATATVPYKENPSGDAAMTYRTAFLASKVPWQSCQVVVGEDCSAPLDITQDQLCFWAVRHLVSARASTAIAKAYELCLQTAATGGGSKRRAPNCATVTGSSNCGIPTNDCRQLVLRPIVQAKSGEAHLLVAI